MTNLKTKVISAAVLVSLVGMPVVGLAQVVPTSVGDAKAAVKKELGELKTAREALKTARQQEADERAKEAKERVEAKRKEIEANRLEIAKRKEANRKEVLLRLIDVQVKHLNNIWRRVQNMPNILEAKKTELKTEIDKAVAGLNALKTKVQEATAAEQLKAATQELRSFIKSKNELIKKIVEAITADALKDISVRAEERIKTAEEKIAELKTAGKDVAALENLLAVAKSKLEAAKTAGTREAWAEMKDALKAVYETLKEFAEKAEESD